VETNKNWFKGMELKHIPSNNSVISVLQDFPFEIKRVYYIQGMGFNDIRGKHSHIKNRQIITCVQGTCDLLVDNILTIRLNKDEYFLLEPSHYHEMTHFSENCIILVLASEKYEEADYIRKADSKSIRNLEVCLPEV
jgi:hypothetical protein